MSKEAKEICNCWTGKSWRCSSSDIKLFSRMIGVFLGTDLPFKPNDVYWRGFVVDRYYRVLNSESGIVYNGITKNVRTKYMTNFKIIKCTPKTIKVQCIGNYIWIANYSFSFPKGIVESMFHPYVPGNFYTLRPSLDRVNDSYQAIEIIPYFTYPSPLDDRRHTFYLGQDNALYLGKWGERTIMNIGDYFTSMTLNKE